MEIRLLDLRDAEKYLEIRLEGLQKSSEAFASSYEEEKDRPVDTYRKRFDSPLDSFTYGAFAASQLVGVVTLVKEKLYKLRHRTNIVAMYITPSKRGLGIGKAMVLEAIKKANDLEGIEQIHLTVVTTNEPAKRLYSSLGFEVTGTEKKALKFNHTYLDEEQMVLFL